MAAHALPFKVQARTPKPESSEVEASRRRGQQVKLAIDRTDTVLTSYEARIAGFDLEIKKLQARKKHAAARCAAIEDRVLELMSDAGLDKLTGNRATLSKRANALSLVVDDQKLIPPTFLRTKTTTQADKVAIKVALERGVEIGGVRLVQSISLIRK